MISVPCRSATSPAKSARPRSSRTVDEPVSATSARSAASQDSRTAVVGGWSRGGSVSCITRHGAILTRGAPGGVSARRRQVRPRLASSPAPWPRRPRPPESGRRRPVPVQEMVDRWLAPARATAGRAAEQLVAEGRRLTLQEAVDLVLANRPDDAPPPGSRPALTRRAAVWRPERLQGGEQAAVDDVVGAGHV